MTKFLEYLPLDKSLSKIIKCCWIAISEESNSNTRFTSTTGTTNTMCIIFNALKLGITSWTILRNYVLYLGHIVVDNHWNISNINTTTSNICCNQDWFFTIFEWIECEFSLFLTLTTMQWARWPTLFFELTGKNIATLLLIDEYNNGTFWCWIFLLNENYVISNTQWVLRNNNDIFTSRIESIFFAFCGSGTK